MDNYKCNCHLLGNRLSKISKNLGVDITAERLKNWCKENMALWKYPNYIEFIEVLPVTTTGKVQRRLLQENDISKLNEGREIKG